MFTETFEKKSIVRIFNLIRLIFEKHLWFNPLKDYRNLSENLSGLL